jgi:hypothetical protein
MNIPARFHKLADKRALAYSGLTTNEQVSGREIGPCNDIVDSVEQEVSTNKVPGPFLNKFLELPDADVARQRGRRVDENLKKGIAGDLGHARDRRSIAGNDVLSTKIVSGSVFAGRIVLNHLEMA